MTAEQRVAWLRARFEQRFDEAAILRRRLEQLRIRRRRLRERLDRDIARPEAALAILIS